MDLLFEDPYVSYLSFFVMVSLKGPAYTYVPYPNFRCALSLHLASSLSMSNDDTKSAHACKHEHMGGACGDTLATRKHAYTQKCDLASLLQLRQMRRMNVTLGGRYLHGDSLYYCHNTAV